MLCEICHKSSGNFSAILGDIYYRNICLSCKSANMKISSGHARWSRSIDVEDHEADIQQPWNADGTINTRFAQLYPEQAKAVFTAEELDKAMRR